MYEDEDKALEALAARSTWASPTSTPPTPTATARARSGSAGSCPTRRKEVTLATKLSARKADDARRQIELSLKRLQTDHLDVLHIHALAGPDDLAAIEAPDGVLKALYEARDQKVARAIGITCHAAPAGAQDGPGAARLRLHADGPQRGDGPHGRGPGRDEGHAHARGAASRSSPCRWRSARGWA